MDEFDDAPYKNFFAYRAWQQRRRAAYANQTNLILLRIAKNKQRPGDAERLEYLKEQLDAIEKEQREYDHRLDSHGNRI